MTQRKQRDLHHSLAFFALYFLSVLRVKNVLAQNKKGNPKTEVAFNLYTKA
jgi:hypothetical protein